MPNSVTVLVLIRHLYLSGMWLGVALGAGTKHTCVEKDRTKLLRI